MHPGKVKRQPANVVLADFSREGEWPFLKALESGSGSEWIVRTKVTNRLHGGAVKNMLRMCWYFLFPLAIVFRRKRYGKIVGWQQFYGLNFAFWCRLFHLKKVNDLTVMTFIYKKRNGLAGSLYHKYMKYIVTSRYIDRFICFSKKECEYYASDFGVDADRFCFVPLGVAPVKDMDVADDGFLFATGRSNRNYDFLVDALSGTSIPVKIACDSYVGQHIPDNIEVLRNCYGDDTFRLMAKCHCVLIPLEHLNMSSGHLVALQAMSLGKPVICTDADGIRDYVEAGKTGFLVPNKREAWLSALEYLKDRNFYNKMSDVARKAYDTRFSETVMYGRISELING